jgi:hypothetical protein
MRWIRCFSLAGLVAIGLTAQTQAGLFDCFMAKKKAQSDSCAACATAQCATTNCTTGANACATTGQGCGPAACGANAYGVGTNCTTGCTTGCATTAPAKSKSHGLFSIFSHKKQSQSSCATICTNAACTTANGCTTGGCTTAHGCEPSCAAPSKPARRGLFSGFARKSSSSCATTCSTACHESTCACPSGCTTAPVCVAKPAYCTAPPVCVSKPVCTPTGVCTGTNGCTSGCTSGCATTSCGTCAPVYQPAAPQHAAPAHQPVAPVVPGNVHEAPKAESLPNQGGVETIKPLPPAPKSGAYYQNRIPNEQSSRSEVRRDGLADLFGVSN